ncbi:MAG: AAA family ATPase [Thermodesulfovibrio sp.]|nr:AAA family ATPase [Thermodesulfovibrio sp.]MDW7972191.1 AAA family ATPase [Thermodesulfovibrio sp.]
MIKIKRILIENIGPYKNKEFIFGDSCNLVVDKNETGKSVLAKAIFETLYPSKQPLVSLNNGKITLEIEAEDKFFQIIRDYKGYQIFQNGYPLKYETKSKGKIVKKLPGEIIFKIPKEIFINTSYLAQKSGLNTKQLYQVTSFLEKAIDTGFQETSASSALLKIKEALYDNIHSGSLFPFTTKGKLDTAIKIWEEKLSEYEEKKSYLKDLIKKETEIITTYAHLLSELENLNTRIMQLESDYATWKIKQDTFYRKEIQNLEERNKELLKELEKPIHFFYFFDNLRPQEQQFIMLYENEVNSLQKDLTFKKERKEKIKKFLKNLYLISIPTFILSLLGGIFINNLFYLGAILVIAVVIYQIKLNSENRKITNEIERLKMKLDDISQRIDDIISKFNIPIKDKREFFTLFEKMNTYKSEIKEFIENSRKIEELKKILLSESEIDFYESKITYKNNEININNIEEYEQNREKLIKLREEIKDKLYKMQSEYDKIMQYKKEIEKINEQIQSITRNIETLRRFKKALQKSFEVLETITKRHHEIWAEKLNKKASTLLSKITNKEISISFNKDLSFNVKVPEIDFFLPETEIENRLSGGMTEQIYLAVRLIIAELLSLGRKIPFILDEPFAHSDDERFIKGMKYLIEEIANSNQVIILSCHQHRLKLIEELKSSFYLISLNRDL